MATLGRLPYTGGHWNRFQCTYCTAIKTLRGGPDTLFCILLLVIVSLFHAGTPNQPKLGAITFNKGSITLSWTIGRDDLRPIEGYNITIETIQVKNRVSRSTSTRVNRQIGGDMRIETRRITVTEVCNMQGLLRLS